MTTIADSGRSPGFTAALLASSCFSMAFMLTPPGLVGSMLRDWGITEQQVGQVVTADLAGTAIGSLLMCFILGGWRVRFIVQLSAVLLGLGNVLTALHLQSVPLELARTISGIGGGLMAGVGMRFLAMGEHCTRNMTWVTVLQQLFTVFMLTLGLPALTSAGGAERPFEAYAAAGLLCFGIAFYFARDERSTSSPALHIATADTSNPASDRVKSWMLLAAIFAQYVGVGIGWTFLESRGTSIGFSAEDAQQYIGLHNLAGIPVCLLAPYFEHRVGIAKSTIGALALCCAALTLLAYPTTALTFHVSTFVFIATWCLSTSTLLGWLSAFDHAGRYLMLTPAVICVGGAVGAGMAGWIAERTGMTTAFLIGAAANGASMLLSLVVSLQKPATRVDMPQTNGEFN